MRLRARRRNLVVWRSPGGPARLRGYPGRTGPAHPGRIRRVFRAGGLLVMIGVMRLARGVRPRWQPVLAGAVLTVTGFMLRSGAWGALFPAGLWFFVYALLMPGGPEADHKRRAELERELAAYATPAQRRDLEATFDRYPDGITHELREILARQSLAACNEGVPGAGRS